MQPNDDLIQLALDETYGLLEPEAAAAARERLATPEGAVARRRAAELQELLSAAARLPFPEARFTPPALPAPAIARRGQLRWVGWVVAASALMALAIPTLAGMAEHRFQTQRAIAAEESAAAALKEFRARTDVWKDGVRLALAEHNRAAAELDRLKREIEESVQARTGELRQGQLNVVVSGPAAATPGAPNRYQVETLDLAGRRVAAELRPRVVDQSGAVVYEPPPVATGGLFTLRLPPDLPLTPDRELTLEMQAKRPDGPAATVRQSLPLAAPVYLAHLTTDKPLYQPGETVRIRALVLERGKLQPPAEDLTLTVSVLDPQGAELLAQTGRSRLGRDDRLRGLAATEFTLGESAPGGEYTIRLKEASGRTSEQVRRFLVNRYQPATLEKKLEFARKSYGPGDEVEAVCQASRVNGPLANQPVSASAQVDGQELPVRHAATTDARGGVVVKFRLPREIARGAASVSVRFTDGGVIETLVKPVPVVIRKLSVDFYPEGGDLVAGVPNRVYLQARTPLGKPADVKGRIVDDAGQTVAAVETLSDDREPGINQGQARFEFTPAVGRKYKLAVDRPEGITSEHVLPNAVASGVVLNTGTGVATDQSPLPLTLYVAGAERSLIVGAYARGRLLDQQRVRGVPGRPIEVTLKPAAGFGGITRITVFEETGSDRARQLKPLAERLVFRAPAKRLEVAVTPDKLAYAPSEKARLKVAATDESGRAVPAVALVGVVNQSVVVMADEKSFRGMPTHFLLTGEVEQAEDLEHVDVLLGTHPKAAAALDLLLGVQGWRRFAESADIPPDGMATGRAGRASPQVRMDSFEYIRLTATNTKNLREAERSLWEAGERLERAVAVPPELDILRAQALTVVGEAEHATAARQAAEAANATRVRSLLAWIAGLSALGGAGALGLAWALGTPGRAEGLALLALAFAATLGWTRFVPVSPAMPVEAEVRGKSESGPVSRRSLEFAPWDYFEELERGPGSVKDKAQLALAFEAGGLANRGFAFGGLGGGPPGGRGGLPPVAGGGPAAPGMPPEGVDPVEAGLPGPAPKILAPMAGGRSGAPDRGGMPGTEGRAEPTRSAAPAKPAAPRVPLADRGRDPAAGRGVGDAARGDHGLVLRESLARRARDIPRLATVEDRKAVALAERVLAGGDRANALAAGTEPEAFFIREYAHVHRPSPDGARTDFTETVFWHPALIVPSEGTTIAFDLADSVTRYQILAAVHTLDGRLGALKSDFAVRKPLSIDVKLPVEITSGDRLELPVTVSNELDQPRAVGLTLETPGLMAVGQQPAMAWTQAGRTSGRRVFPLRPVDRTSAVRIRAGLGQDDAVERILPVVPEGFPVEGQISDELRGTAKHVVTLPARWVPGSLKCEVVVFPSPLADLQRGLEGLLREPGGCFEQTSTTNYPNTLIMDYLRETNQARPDLVANARGLLDRGYARLTSFEVPAGARREGFEWFGHAPAHEALTAYGLLQFRDMARVAEVDPALLERTRNYLMSRRDGRGGFQRSKAALDSFGRASEQVTNAYIVWAMTESGSGDDLTAELDRLQTESATSGDPYFLALVANALWNRGRHEPARAILGRLVTLQRDDGSLPGGEKSITGSQGQPLVIETTALALLGWLKANQPAEFGAAVRKGVKWVGRQRQGSGSFGPTQSTILALKALIAYAQAYKQPPEAGTLTLARGDEVIATIDYTADRQDAIVLEIADPAKFLQGGDNPLELRTSGKNLYPYTVAWSYHTLQPPSAADCAVRLSADLAKAELAEGESTRINVRLENVSKKGQGMTVAIIGLPAGLALPDDFRQLRDFARLVDGRPGKIAHWEIRGRELVLYWRDLAPDARIELSVDVIARIPGKYRGPASRAYLYYNPEAKRWTAPLVATIRAGE